MVNRLFENFERYFPIAAKKAESYSDYGYGMLVIKLIDGEVLMYDDFDQTIRHMPSNSEELTEHQCAREFGIKLSRVLRCRGISQSDLSAMTGLSRVQINKYINGKAMPSFYVVDKMAKALKCSVDDLRYFE